MAAGTIGSGVRSSVVVDADHFARHLDEVPVLCVICVKWADVHIPDRGLDRPSFVGGGSVYPIVQNLILGCREIGLGATMTSLLAEFEPEIRELIRLPGDIAVGGVVAIGWPARTPPTRLKRKPVEELVFRDRYGEPLAPPG